MGHELDVSQPFSVSHIIGSQFIKYLDDVTHVSETPTLHGPIQLTILFHVFWNWFALLKV